MTSTLVDNQFNTRFFIKTRLRNFIMVRKEIITVIVIASLLSVNAVPRSKPEPETSTTTSPQQKLQIISATEERLEFNFFTPTSGIHVLSVVHSDGEAVQLSITSMRGEVIFAVNHPVDSSQNLMTIVGNEFLILNETLDTGETKMTEYVVPEAYSLQVKNGLKQHVLSKSLLQHLDHDNVESSGRSATETLLIRPEAEIIVAAAVKLGNNGVYGYESPAAMAFYTTAMRFSSATNQPATNKPVVRNKRGLFDWLFGDYCPVADGYCTTCPQEPNCYGLCGPGCDCWWWVCFDCCYNSGCYWHDVHGCSGGRNTLSCWLTAPVALLACW